MAEQKELTLQDLVAVVNKQNETIAALQLQLAANKGAVIETAAEEIKPTLPKEPVSYKGDKYAFIIPSFVIDGETFTAEQASLDETIMAKILKVKGQNIARKLA